MENQAHNNNMLLTSSTKPKKTLAEKGQHLKPLKRFDTTRVMDSDHRDSQAGSGDFVLQNADQNVGSGCCHSTSDINRRDTEAESGTNNGRSKQFVLGADSVDDADDGLLLSPTSPTSSTTSTSPCSPGARARRKSSLRDPHRSKTPPGTPCKKSVRFADALGLDLETVRTILRTESPPELPSLNVDHETQTICAKTLTLCFQQPGGRPDFLRRLHQQTVCLENVVVHEFTVIGTIKVKNLGYDKNVRIRHSSDNWHSYVDVMAMYVQGSCDGPTDRFSFGLSAPRSLAIGGIVRFAIYYKVAGQIFWDNNGGQNYSLVCEEVTK